MPARTNHFPCGFVASKNLSPNNNFAIKITDKQPLLVVLKRETVTISQFLSFLAFFLYVEVYDTLFYRVFVLHRHPRTRSSRKRKLMIFWFMRAALSLLHDWKRMILQKVYSNETTFVCFELKSKNIRVSRCISRTKFPYSSKSFEKFYARLSSNFQHFLLA